MEKDGERRGKEMKGEEGWKETVGKITQREEGGN